MAVPLVDLKRQYARLREEIRAAIDRVCDAQAFVLGREVEAFERAFAEWSGVKHCIGMTSGSDALIAALMALDVGPGDEVIVPPFTFFATAGAVHRLGATIVFADIESATFNLDPACVAKKITPKTKAIVPVHLFGQCADMEGLLEAAGDIPIIEDAAQSQGAQATINGEAVTTGAIGKIAAFSFYPAKNIGAFGDAGAVTTDDPDLADRLRRLRNHGQSAHQYLHDEVGGNFRLDGLQAAVLGVKLPHLDAWTAARQVHAQRYVQQFAEHGLGGADSPLVVPPVAQPRHVWNQFTVRIRNGRRDAVRDALRERGIGCAVYYPLPLHRQPCFYYVGDNRDGAYPISEQAAAEVLSIPIVPEVTEAEHDEVVAALVDAVKE